jgi:glycosyltransferase involved in cell wall biosynthesis
VPSRAESFPYVVLEAGAAGKPLIATRVGGIPEIVAETQTELVEAGSVPDLIRAMEWVLANPAEAQARAAELRATVQRKFTVAAMTDQVLDFYRPASN